MFKDYFNPTSNPNIFFLFPVVAFMATFGYTMDWTWLAIAMVFLTLSINK